MAFFRFIAKIFGSKKTTFPLRYRHNRHRLVLEMLEDRVMPSITVMNLNDGGAGSLRAAIVQANATPGPDVIHFNVAGVISLTTGALPAVAGTVQIDGSTAPGFTGSPRVEVDFNGFGGLRFNSGSAGSTLRAVGLVHAGGDGVTLNAGQILLAGNYIGVGLNGATAAGNSGNGVSISATSLHNTIGGTSAGDPNVISGNAGNGIVVNGSVGNSIVANLIGADASGSSDVGNGANGILLTGGARSNLIGGVTPLAAPPPNQYIGKPVDGNVISGNGQNGVLIRGSSQFNQLSGNFIGTDLSGNVAMGNTLDGVAIINGSNNNSMLGAVFTLPGVEDPFVFYNVVSGNGLNGLRINNSNNSVIQANFFGLGANNNTPVPNTLDGVLIEGSSANTQFGGVIPLGNVATANGQNGVEIRDTASRTIAFNTFAGLGAFNNSPTLGNQQDGFHIISTGGNNLLRTNVISGNHDDGIEISGNARGVTVDKAIIGLNTNGFLFLPNHDNGIEIGGNAHDNIISSFEPSIIPQNVISGNLGNGVAIIGNANHNQVLGTFIGTDVNGAQARQNHGDGVFIGDNANHNTIGGNATGDDNLISGNAGDGVELADNAHHNDVIDNQIGSNRAGTGTFGNGGDGLFLGSGAQFNTISGNEAINNSDAGFYLLGSNHNMLADNSAVDNFSDGFRLVNCDFNTLRSNSAIGNGGSGFDVVDSNHNRFIDNSSELNGGYGYFVDDVLNNIFNNNTCANNALGGSNQPGIC